jgi:hypothetical protein
MLVQRLGVIEHTFVAAQGTIARAKSERTTQKVATKKRKLKHTEAFAACEAQEACIARAIADGSGTARAGRKKQNTAHSGHRKKRTG